MPNHRRLSAQHRLSAQIALVFAAVLAVGEVVRNWGTWQWWPFWVVDFIGAGLLLTGGLLTLRRRPGASAWLAGSWGFTVAMFYMSFWGHVETINEPSGANIPHGPLTAIIGLMLVVAAAGFVLALWPDREGERGPASGPIPRA